MKSMRTAVCCARAGKRPSTDWVMEMWGCWMKLVSSDKVSRHPGHRPMYVVSLHLYLIEGCDVL